jgi:hypothetical protein
MGDARHKKSPPPADLEEDVTPDFRRKVREVLELNKLGNQLRGLRKSDEGYLVSNQAELADAIGVDRNLIKNMLGGVRAGTKVRLIARSTYVGAIRRVLHLAPVIQVAIRADRAAIVKLIAELPDPEFSAFEKAMSDRLRDDR